MMDVIVIGGGAAGMAAAITAAEAGDSVLLLERMDRVGKKLLATGNGRCNLMNTGELRYPGGAAFAHKVLSLCGAKEQQRFWIRHGLQLRQEDGGRVYPVSGQASTVLDTLRLAMEASGVRILTGVQVDGVSRSKSGFSVYAGEEFWQARRVILAGGGCAQPKLGSDGSCWKPEMTLNHLVNKACPVLTQIMTDVAPIRGLSGIRVRGSVRVYHGEHLRHEEQGEILFADYGVSGVCVMQCARYVQQRDSWLSLNLAQGMGFTSETELQQELLRRRSLWPDLPLEQILTGLCVPRLSSALCAAAGITWKNRSMSTLNKREASSLAGIMFAFPLKVKGVKGFDTAQVSTGGLAVDQYDPATMESLKTKDLYAAGEVLDVDGDCGGFNLMFAFGSGILAGLAGRKNPDGGNE